jgi:hypothetical protein
MGETRRCPFGQIIKPLEVAPLSEIPLSEIPLRRDVEHATIYCFLPVLLDL